jgi:uncharacterized protein YdaU (DUF1376 family)
MVLGKPTWFKLEPAAFLSDVQVDAMTTLELGACFRLLCRQWIDGFVPDDMHVVARLCRLSTTEMAEVWQTLSKFFPVVEEGKRANRFMRVERERVVADLVRRSNDGVRSARKRWTRERSSDAELNGSPMEHPMQQKSREENSRKRLSSEQHTSDDEMSPPTESSLEPSGEACGVAALLQAEILRNKPDYRITEAQIRKWGITADRMQRIDGRTVEQIADLIRWVQHDEFWRTNVLSMDTLRAKFDQLEMKAKSQNAGSNKAATMNLPPDYVPASARMLEERRDRTGTAL